MTLRMALSGTMAGNFLLAALVLAGVKLAAAIAQVAMMRGRYRAMPKGAWFRAVYMAGKVTPALAAVCAFVSAMLLHSRSNSWFFGCFAGFVTALAVCVVRLRKQGKFFGVLEMFSSR